MVTLPYGKPRQSRDFSDRHLLSRPEWLQPAWFCRAGQYSSAVKDSRQLIRVFAFSLESAADRGERLGQRKDVAGNKQIGIFGADRMPVNSVSGNGDFGHQIGSTDRDPVTCSAAQCDSAYHSVFWGDPLIVEKQTKLFSLGIGGNSGSESHSKSLRTSELNTSARSHPCSRPAMEIVPFRRRAVQADLQDHSIAG